MKNKTFREFITEVFCENGIASSKRVFGGFIIVVIMFCTLYCCMAYGITDNAKSVIEIEMITAGSLLGITSITNIWKNKGKHRNDENIIDYDDNITVDPPYDTTEDIESYYEEKKEEEC